MNYHQFWTLSAIFFRKTFSKRLPRTDSWQRIKPVVEILCQSIWWLNFHLNVVSINQNIVSCDDPLNECLIIVVFSKKFLENVNSIFFFYSSIIKRVTNLLQLMTWPIWYSNLFCKFSHSQIMVPNKQWIVWILLTFYYNWKETEWGN